MFHTQEMFDELCFDWPFVHLSLLLFEMVLPLFSASRCARFLWWERWSESRPNLDDAVGFRAEGLYASSLPLSVVWKVCAGQNDSRLGGFSRSCAKLFGTKWFQIERINSFIRKDSMNSKLGGFNPSCARLFRTTILD
jgi:hypothetical protein